MAVWSRNLDKNAFIGAGEPYGIVGLSMRGSAAAILVFICLIASCLIMPLSVKAGSKTLVVPDDYATIEAAIENATDGDTIFVKAGTYEENPLEINKALSLVGEGAGSTKICFDPPYTEETWNILEHYKFYETPITVTADDFTLSGFKIVTTGGQIVMNGNGTKIMENEILTGLQVSGSQLKITGNIFPCEITISGSYSNISANIGYNMRIHGSFCDVSLNSFSGSASAAGGIWFEGNFCLVHDNDMKASDGILGGNNNIIYRNVVDDASNGLAVGGSNNTVCLNRVTNCRVGLSPRAENTYYANYVAYNRWGVDTGDTELNPTGTAATLYHNNFVGNTYQVWTSGTYESDYFDNGKEGNYWSAYSGVDVDGDGIGDTPYVIDDNRSDRFPLTAPFDIDSVTVELPEWASPPTLRIISPENSALTSANVTLEFNVSKQTSWLGYSLDGQDNVTIGGNATVTGLPSGLHNVTVYARDEFGNVGASETVWFSVAEPFPVVPVAAASAASVAVAVAGLLVYLRRRNHGAERLSRNLD
jgi:hypothetical protein